MDLARCLALATSIALSALLACAPVTEVAAQPKSPPAAKPEGEVRWALYVTMSPQWFDPGEVLGNINPFWFLYAMHDALVKPMPGNLMTPSLAESWTLSADQRTYEFKLREGVKFHNGDPFTAEDVKFSFQRAKGARLLKEKVREVAVVDPHPVRFHLHEPFPDFMAFYGTLTTGAGWIVPKQHIEKVGDDAFKKHPIGLGPYRFVSQNVGVELILEAYEGYWRKVPSVKRLVFRGRPGSHYPGRHAQARRGRHRLHARRPPGPELQNDPSLRLRFPGASARRSSISSTCGTPSRPGPTSACAWRPTMRIDRRGLSEMETLGPRSPPGTSSPARSSSPCPSSPIPTTR